MPAPSGIGGSSRRAASASCGKPERPRRCRAGSRDRLEEIVEMPRISGRRQDVATWRPRGRGAAGAPCATPGGTVRDPLRTRCTGKPRICWRARQESNLYQELRKLSFYPLNYGRSARRRYCTQFCAICMKRIKSSLKLIENPSLLIGRTSLTPLYNPAFACRRAGLPPTCAVLIFCCRRQAPPVPVSRIWS